MKALIVVLGLVVLAIGGYGYWLHRSLHPLMSSKGVQAELKTFVAPNEREPTELIDLGFARFELPKSLAGTPTTQNDDLFISFGEGAASVNFFVGPPVTDDNPEWAQLLADLSQATDERFETSYTLRQRALSAQPFTVFDIPFKGLRKTEAEAVLLLLKATFSLDAPIVWQGDTERVGLFWVPSERVDIITVFDKQKRVTQEFLLNPDSKQATALVASLLATYRFVSDASDMETWRAEARSAGVRFKPQEDASVDVLSDEERLQRIADEIQARRARRKALEQ
ncbi:MAG: hypothetical protein H7A44_12150 [Opitutaceae bacterium]|nr:hypothetical protein [Opitutaceae bacterium]